MIIENIAKCLDDVKIEVVPVKFPMMFSGLDDSDIPLFKFANGSTHALSELGAGYLSERFSKFKYAHCTKAWRDEQWQELEDITHSAQTNKIYQAATINNAIVGIMSNYNPVSHEDVLDTIKAAGLDSKIVNWDLNLTGIEIEIEVYHYKSARVTLQINNGHSGHYGLKYSLVMRFGSYAWVNTLISQKHLSNIFIGVNELISVYNDIRFMETEESLKNISMTEVNLIIEGIQKTSRQQRMLNIVMGTNPKNAFDFIVSMSEYASTVGYASAVNKLLNPIMKEVSR